MAKILLVDDDPQSLDSTQRILEFAGHSVIKAMDGRAALEGVLSNPDVVVSDVRMPKMSGLELLRALRLRGAEVPVVLMTAFGRVDDAVWAMKFGAIDFLAKPFRRQSLLDAIDAALARGRATRGGVAAETLGAGRLIGSSPAMNALRTLIQRVGPTDATVLIHGESGSGKELVAREIHDSGSRKGRPFVALNCAAIPEQLIEAELFGHEKGAFTGAQAAKEGLFETADGGTLLLDEIGDMPLALQARLLRVIQEGEVRRVGANQSRKVDVRLVAATHRDLRESVREGKFRQDLLFRLEVIQVAVPPLRERLSDVPELVAHFIADFSSRHRKSVHRVSDAVLEALRRHFWPGNVRELANVVERAVIFATSDEVAVVDLPAGFGASADREGPSEATRSVEASVHGQISVPVGTSLKDVEELLIRKTLEATDGDKSMTAKLLGINSRTIYRKLEKAPQ